MKKGFTLIELLIVIVVIAILMAILLPALQKVIEKSRQTKCKANLDQFGKALKIYTDDFGKNRYYPDTNGAGFLARLYQLDVVGEWQIYLCPSTPDENDEGEELTDLYAEEELPEGGGAVSYGGRKNKHQSYYPGFFTIQRDTTVTSMATDDIDQPEDMWNHENLINILFLDAHTEHMRREHPEFEDILDPLTN